MFIQIRPSGLLVIVIANLFSIGYVQANGSLPKGVEPNWWANVQKDIAKSEYEIKWQEKYNEYQSPNRMQGLRFSYYPDGFKVKSRREDNWSVEIRLKEFGRKGREEYKGGELTVQNNKGYVIGNGIDIRYENGESGMREDFIVLKRARGEGELILEFEVKLDRVNMEINDEGVIFSMNVPGGAGVLRYGDMKITDKEGKEFKGEFKFISDNRFAILVEDKDADYPITIDPLSSSPDWTGESNQAYAEYGFSVSTAGDVNGDGYSDVVIGAHGYDNGETDEGRAFVYYGSATGLSSTPNWTGESNQASANYGVSVSTAGDVNGDGYSDVVIGANGYDNGETDEGRAFVYYGSATGLSSTPNWTGESNQASANYGRSVSTAGDVNGDGYSDVIIGADYYDNGEADEGRAYVYHGSATGLSSTPDWTGESNQAIAYYGLSASTGGDVNGDGYSDVIVGAHGYDNGEADEGRAFVYYGSATGLSSTPNWTTESNQVSAWYAVSVSTAGDVNGDGYSDVVIGAHGYDNGETDEGRAFVYYGSATGLSSTPNWTGESNQAEANYGRSVSTADDVNGDGYSDVIIGARVYDNGQTDEGMVYVYYGSATGLSTTPNWTGESNQASAYYGFSVSTVGDVNGDGYSDVIIGAYGCDNGETDEGCAFVYYGSASGLSLTPDWTGESNQAGAYYGYSVSTAGDVQGDGYSDVIIGAPWFDNGEIDEGCAFVYYGSTSGLSTSPDWIGESNQGGARYGYSVSTAGDVQGDGYSDVIIGADYYDNGETNEGRAFVYYGSATGLSSTPDWTGESNQAGARYGRPVSQAGDVNGDGYSDVIIGAADYDNGETDEGRAFVYYGSASGLSLTPNWTGESNQASAYYGISVSTAGDVNGDGYSDVIIGAHCYDNGETNEGSAFVYYGSASGLSLTPDWTGESNQASAYYGISVSTAGDVNGDGYSDVIIGAYGCDNGETDEGCAFVYYGSASGLSTSPDWIGESNQAGAYYGWSVSTAGDVNGDGYSDVIIGARLYDNGETDEGRAFVYYGSASGLSLTPNWTGESNQIVVEYGHSVSTAGDVNGDGYSDVVISAHGYDNGEADEGRAFVYYGNEGRGRMITPEQMRADFSVPIVPPLFSNSNNSFGSRLWGSSDYGRVLVKGQFEVKPLGTPFNGFGFVETDWIDLDTTGHEITQVIQGLSVNTLYKWRARIKYHPKYGLPIHSRWYYIQYNGLTESDFRTGIEVGIGEGYSPIVLPSSIRLTVEYLSSAIRFKYSGLNGGCLIIYNLLGAEIKRIPVHDAGEYEWEGQDDKGNIIASGVYFARLVSDQGTYRTAKFVLIK